MSSRFAPIWLLAAVASLACLGGWHLWAAPREGDDLTITLDDGAPDPIDTIPVDDERDREAVSRIGFYGGRQRLIRRFNFEETRANNPNAVRDNFEDMPEDWYRIGSDPQTPESDFEQVPWHKRMIDRAGFPKKTDVRFDKPQRETGNHSLYLGLNGGSAGAFVAVGAVNATARSDYLVAARLKTTTLKHARARLVAYLLDAEGTRIDESAVATPLMQTGGKWQKIETRVRGDYPQAAWIGLHVELIQPALQPAKSSGEHRLFYEEVFGGAWFDDVEVWQIPRLEISIQNDVNVLRAPQRPQLTLSVRDLTGSDLLANLRVLDHMHRVVDEQQMLLNSAAPKQWRWQPKLDRYGWYMVDMQLREDHRLVGRSVSAFLYLPAQPSLPPSERNRFMIDATNTPDEHYPLLPELMRRVQMHSVGLSAWDREMTLSTLDKQQSVLAELVNELSEQECRVALSFAWIPKEIASPLDLEADESVKLFMQPRELYQSYLDPVLMRHGQRVNHWQLGPPYDATAFFIPRLGELYSEITESIQERAPGPRVIVPWTVHQSWRPELGPKVILALDVPPGVRPEHMGGHLREYLDAPNGPESVIVHLREAGADKIDHQRRIDGFAARMLYAWEAGSDALAMHRPWTRSANRHLDILPDPLLGVFAQVAHYVAGRRVVGRLPLEKGMVGMILDGYGGGALAAWLEGPFEGDAELRMYLGEKPVAVDLWGNRTPLRIENGQHVLKLSTTPVFIEGIDTELALFRASFALNPDFIESDLTPHTVTMSLRNPWTRTISGTMTFTDPEGWRIAPLQLPFSLQAGKSMSVPLTLRFPVSEVAGEKKLVARVAFTAEKRYKVQLKAPLTLGMRNIRYDATLSIEDDPMADDPKAVVTAVITNTGPTAVSLYAFANLAGYPRKEYPIPRLMPGETVIRRFHFPDALAQLAIHHVRVGLRQTTGPVVLNKLLTIDTR